jgi:hypothetical protein
MTPGSQPEALVVHACTEDVERCDLLLHKSLHGKSGYPLQQKRQAATEVVLMLCLSLCAAAVAGTAQMAVVMVMVVVVLVLPLLACVMMLLLR